MTMESQSKGVCVRKHLTEKELSDQRLSVILDVLSPCTLALPRSPLRSRKINGARFQKYTENRGFNEVKKH